VCGIVGVVLAGEAPVDQGVVAKMTSSLAHRGPDGEGTYFAPGVGLGHRRLAIVDLTDTGRQPMRGQSRATSRESVLTFNGEIYNWDALRASVKAEGRTVRSTGDTEVLLGALDLWGAAALDRVEGMFAFGYYRSGERSLLLARDRFGEKPLYYAPLGDGGREGVVFASELRAMLEHPRVRAERTIDPRSVAQFFVHEFVPAPRSIFANVKKLEAGQLLTWTEGRGVTLSRYYAAPFGGPRAHVSGEEAARELVRVTEASTRARLQADVPVGVFLSGGLDSSFLAACAVRVHPRVRTFTVGFDDKSFDESAHARDVARHLGTSHVEYRIGASELLEILPGMLDWMDEPFADTSLLPTTLLAREVRRDVTVSLGGEGGDELLAGYPTFVVDSILSRLPRIPSLMTAAAARAARLVPPDSRNFSRSFVARQLAQGLGSTGARRHASWLAPLIPRDLEALAGPLLDAPARAHAFDATDECVSGLVHPSAFDAATAFYLRLYLGEGVLTKVDRATMRASLEARAPLLDRRVAEFCLSLPPRTRLRGRTTKWVLRRAAATLLPASIARRPKKGFGAPVGAWLKGPLSGLAREMLSADRVRAGGWLDPEAVASMLDAHIEGRADLRKPLYAALVFEAWRRRWA
jgi:asparagine synthase (glutamine-hydrolysing)